MLLFYEHLSNENFKFGWNEVSVHRFYPPSKGITFSPFVAVMSLKCIRCDSQFENKDKRDRHVVEEHLSVVKVEEVTLSRTSLEFPCLYCSKFLKNAKTLKSHLVEKQLQCIFIHDSIHDIAPQADLEENLIC
ncbi:uncharacterized protein B0P05DRAFT_531400 [Gilbertella persicaria]|uniref:uncharacterized protein n=1 Tax=Gilbertella persicaria TaxID=101096 RepID=UPI0022205AD1|nr:uncharacterized protein B0P05DRAFT_531400 [Gilbertella persicaria]KAI8088090.1 hypothetical protein B0P05DRAFT_531400 [Gilbertella persicaria]